MYGTSPHSPLHSFYTNIASTSPNAWVNWLFMLGLLGIGVALTFGVFMRIGTISAVVMLAMMWLAEWPVQQLHDQTGAAVYNAPFLDYHILYGVTILTLMFLGAERWLGLGKWWESLSFVKKLPWLA